MKRPRPRPESHRCLRLRGRRADGPSRMSGQPSARGLRLPGRHRQLPVWAQVPGGSAASGLRRHDPAGRPGVKLIVVACNSAAAAALPQLQSSFATPIVGVVMPGARAAVQATRERRVGLLATEATVRSNAYQNALHTLDAGLEVFAIAAPRLAPLIQGGDVFSEETEGRGRERRRSAQGRRRRHGHPGVHPLPAHIADAQAPAGSACGSHQFRRGDRARGGGDTWPARTSTTTGDREGEYRFLTTGDPEEFREVGARFLQLPIREVEQT